MDVAAGISLLKVAQASAEVNVVLQNKAQDQAETVIATLLQGVDQAAATARQFHSTGQQLNIVA